MSARAGHAPGGVLGRPLPAQLPQLPRPVGGRRSRAGPISWTGSSGEPRRTSWPSSYAAGARARPRLPSVRSTALARPRARRDRKRRRAPPRRRAGPAGALAGLARVLAPACRAASAARCASPTPTACSCARRMARGPAPAPPRAARTDAPPRTLVRACIDLRERLGDSPLDGEFGDCSERSASPSTGRRRALRPRAPPRRRPEPSPRTRPPHGSPSTDRIGYAIVVARCSCPRSSCSGPAVRMALTAPQTTAAAVEQLGRELTAMARTGAARTRGRRSSRSWVAGNRRPRASSSSGRPTAGRARSSTRSWGQRLSPVAPDVATSCHIVVRAARSHGRILHRRDGGCEEPSRCADIPDTRPRRTACLVTRGQAVEVTLDSPLLRRGSA